MKRAKFERWLRRNGATLVRHGSRHDLWRCEERETTVPQHSEIKAGTMRAICKQLQIPLPPER
jgi:predicted RNA binding protein YcfA (HicA-like mRNA interferase family)